MFLTSKSRTPEIQSAGPLALTGAVVAALAAGLVEKGQILGPGCFSRKLLFRVGASVWRCLCSRLSTTGGDSFFEAASPQTQAKHVLTRD